MCLTQDGVGISHAEQASRLCAAGARWIQLRMKDAPRAAWLAEAAAAADACRGAGAILVVNDSVEIALASGADGAHVGGPGADWRWARRRLGPDRILGGTVNSSDDARRAVASGCLDYAGVGPFRFTPTKRNLTPVLGMDGVRALVAGLGAIPAWVIGGVMPGDLAALRAAGAAGAAVSSGLYVGGRIAENLRAYLDAWDAPAELPHDPVPSP
jgi:thiamine-phosphate pyrophosphorylase